MSLRRPRRVPPAGRHRQPPPTRDFFNIPGLSFEEVFTERAMDGDPDDPRVFATLLFSLGADLYGLAAAADEKGVTLGGCGQFWDGLDHQADAETLRAAARVLLCRQIRIEDAE